VQIELNENTRLKKGLKLTAAGRSHLQLHGVPIGKPDAIPRKIWKKKKDQGKGAYRC
jgi:hypothetical protein